ncbi:MAG: hypothetical protein ACLUN0_02605 [Roseburia sp.]
MCHWNTVNWNCIIRKETLEEKLSEEEKHAFRRLQKELAEQKKVELLFTDADMEKDITFFLRGHHIKPEECMLLATEPEEVTWAKKDADSDSDQLTIIGYEVPDFPKQSAFKQCGYAASWIRRSGHGIFTADVSTETPSAVADIRDKAVLSKRDYVR